MGKKAVWGRFKGTARFGLLQSLGEIFFFFWGISLLVMEVVRPQSSAHPTALVTVQRKGKHAVMSNTGELQTGRFPPALLSASAKEIIQFPSSLKPLFLLTPFPPLQDMRVSRYASTTGTLVGMRTPQHWPYTLDGNREHKTPLCSVPPFQH